MKRRSLLMLAASAALVLAALPAPAHTQAPTSLVRGHVRIVVLRSFPRSWIPPIVEELEAHIVHPPEDGSRFAPGYYSVLFEDPDGIRVEVNHVPGKGHLGAGGRLGPGGSGPSDRYE